MHGAVATNRRVAHLNPSVGVGCPFSSETESVFHIFVQFCRLGDLFDLLNNWVLFSGNEFYFQLFIFGPKYSALKKNVLLLINFLFGTAKLENLEKTEKQTF